MDVHLLVYDLSNGLAKQMSLGLLGFQLDAVYHTSIELDGKEYVYDSGINVIRPGTSHLGSPLQRLHLGTTELPMEVILEYLESLKEIYTPQAYDLFRHNCNNFSNDFSMFLVGNGIPDHIANMPTAVLDSPFGRMMQPQLANMVEQRKAQHGGLLGIQNNAQPHTNGSAATTGSQNTTVKVVSNLPELNKALEAAKGSCAIVFFTMKTCGPCRALYPLYDSLAAEHGSKVTFIKVDTSQALDVGRKYSVTGTPTFLTFVHGEEGERWMGADAPRLKGTAALLAQMAVPSHPHRLLRLPRFANAESESAVLYTKVPPLPKLLSKLGSKADDPAVQGVKHFIETRAAEGPAESMLPDLPAFSNFLCSAVADLPPEILFAVVDLFRCALVDPRVSGYFAEEHGHKTVVTLLEAVTKGENVPYALSLVTIHMACNLFSSHLFANEILSSQELRGHVVKLIQDVLLAGENTTTRAAAASLVYNVALANCRNREGGADGPLLPEDDQVDLATTLLEAISGEQASAETLRGMLLALGFLAYCAPMEGELVDLLRCMDAKATVLAKKERFPDERLVAEVGDELLGRGLARQ
ncbi:DUF862-domain-containing protein [Hypoxylon fuscum]|nr:DUF862-domain-containing protein [Hypoxylon fuscum]